MVFYVCEIVNRFDGKKNTNNNKNNNYYFKKLTGENTEQEKVFSK